MADKKISELTELTSVNAENDFFPLVDSSRTETKKMNVANLPMSDNAIGQTFPFTTDFTTGGRITTTAVTSITGGFSSDTEFVYVGSNVTSIGSYAFYYLPSLKEVTLACPITSIGGGAFFNSNNLTKVNIPDSVTSIASQAFMYANLTGELNISNSVTGIGSIAFYGTNITNVVLGDSVSSIGTSSFGVMNQLTGISIDPANTNFSTDGRSIIQSSTNKLIQFAAQSGVTDYTIPSGVSIIGNSAFLFANNLTSLTLISPLTSIENYAFDGCGITGIDLSGVTGIGVGAFGGAVLSGITIPDTVTLIGNRGFAGSNLTGATIGSGLTSISTGLFTDCRNLVSVTFGENLTEIQRQGFSTCHSLTDIIIPNSVTSIGSQAFQYCSSLSGVTLGGSLTGISDNVFADCTSLINIGIPDSVVSLGNGTFDGCSGLTSVTIGIGVTGIGDRTFQECSGLSGIKIPNNATSIGNFAFHDCNRLTGITIPTGVTGIGNSAFDGCSSLATINSLAISAPSLSGSTVFDNVATTQINVPVGATASYQAAGDGNLYGGLTIIDTL